MSVSVEDGVFVATERGTGQRVVRRMLGEHNPHYAFSALCTIAGVYMIGHELEDTAHGRVLLALVLELYSALLIAGAGLLRRVGQQRSAATLGLMAAFFLVDPTLRVEGMVTSDAIAALALAIWLGAALWKVRVLSRVFELRMPVAVQVSFATALLGIVLMPWLMRALSAQHELIATLASFAGALLMASAVFGPWRVRESTGPNLVVVQRSQAAVQWLLIAGYHGHALVTLHAFEVPLGLSIAAPYMALLAALAPSERTTWVVAGFALLICAGTPLTLASMALLLSAALALQYARRGFKRLLVGAVLACSLGLWLSTASSYYALAAPALWLQLACAGMLLLIAHRLRLMSALLTAVLCLAPLLRGHGSPDPLLMGIGVLALGFVALALGIWRDARRTQGG